MLLKLMFLIMLWHRGAASDGLLDVLAGVHGGNRVSLCMGAPEGDEVEGPSRCAGVLWRARWVLTRASCLDYRLLFKVLVLRDREGVSCKDFDNGKELWQARKVRVKFVHPEYRLSPRGDLALVAVDERYHHLDTLANTTTVHNLLSEFSPWLEDVYNQYPMGPRRVSYTHKSSLFSTPLRMFMTSIILPSVSFLLFFLFVIFFTGNGPKDHIPYKSIEYEKYEESKKSDFGDRSLGV